MVFRFTDQIMLTVCLMLLLCCAPGSHVARWLALRRRRVLAMRVQGIPFGFQAAQAWCLGARREGNVNVGVCGKGSRRLPEKAAVYRAISTTL
jgi:hypothetical protein